jgi:hypothetical protein
MPLTRDSFGVLAFLHWNHDWNNFHFREETLDRALIQLRELGIGFVRVDLLWSDLHKGFHRYDFSRADELVKKINAAGLKILAVLQYNKTDLREGKEVWNSPPESFEEFAAYVGATVDRYKSQIHHWEIWNEPNLPVYWNAPKDHLRPYLRLLTMAYAAAKKYDPACTVLNGGLTEPIAEDMENFYANGGKDLTDIVNIHTFVDPLDPATPERFGKIISDVERIMDKYGDRKKKIWITEMGCPGLPADKMNLKWFGGTAVSEEQQATWIEKQYRMIERFPRIEKLFWAFYRDTENEFRDATDYLGLVRLDLTPKPAFFTLKKLIEAS